MPQIIRLYSLGNSLEDIDSIETGCAGVELSTSQLARSRNRSGGDIEKWQKRPLQVSISFLACLDAIHFKVGKTAGSSPRQFTRFMGCRPMGCVMFYTFMRGRVQRAQRDGACIGAYQRRGVEDVLFFCVDGLGGLKRPFWKSTRNRLSSSASCI
ncbi:MAG: transposase [Saprospiraceae bacterium]